MNCDEAQSLLDGYVDGELDATATVSVERHLEDCWSCSQGCDNLQRLKAALRDRALYVPAPLHLVRGLELQFAEPQASPTALPVRSRQSEPATPQAQAPNYSALPVGASETPPALGTPRAWSPRDRLLPKLPHASGSIRRRGGVAAAFVCLLALGWSLRQRALPDAQQDRMAHEVVAGHVRSLQADHLIDLASSDPHRVQGWFNGKLSFSPAVVQSSPKGVTLVGARLDYIDNKPVASLVYKQQQHVVNVFVCPTLRAAAAGADDGEEHSGNNEVNGNLEVRTERGYHLCYGTLGGLTYWVVSDLDTAATRVVASQVIPTVSTKCA